ncbi:Reducing polyketide synthase [Lachnellula willkommii]|uniref:Reducing polyketide synthase n=1 Tax=Lachnellula willkommii TaxID=215461 RepID=A0A559MFF2_9HELO|nr:Reducing polyketide synthase [Lachnellula willkommii]
MARVKLSGALVPIRTRKLHAILDYYCDPAPGMLTGKKPLIGLEMPTNLIARNLEPSPFISEASSSPQSQGTDFSALFSTTKSIDEIGDVVAKRLIERLASAISIPAEDMTDDKAVHHYGVDSLLAIEIRNWFAKKIRADVGVFDILGDLSIKAIATVATGRSSYRKEGASV